MKKRILASLLALVMVLSMVPAALAAETLAPAEQPTQAADSIPAELLIPAEDNTPADELPPADDPQPVQDKAGLDIRIAMKAGSRIKLYTGLEGGNADPANVKEVFQGQDLEYDGWQLMKLVLTIPTKDGVVVNKIEPKEEGLYPELSKLEKKEGTYTYTYYFKQNGTYTFDISYTLNGVEGAEQVEYKVEDLFEVPDLTMRAYFLIAIDPNQYRGYVTITDVKEGRFYNNPPAAGSDDVPYIKDDWLIGCSGGADGFLTYVKNMDGIQYAESMYHIKFDEIRSHQYKNPIDVDSLEPLTKGYYPNMSEFRITEIGGSKSYLKKDAYDSKMIGAILEKMPNLDSFTANQVGFTNTEAFGKMTGNNLSNIELTGNGITSLHGLENHRDISRIWVNNNDISDVTPLKNLTHAGTWNFIKNKVSDLRPVSKLESIGVVAFWLQRVDADPVLVVDKGDSYELELPMPIDIDGSLTKVGFADLLRQQGVKVPEEQKINLTVRDTDGDLKYYKPEERNGKIFVTIPKIDVANAGTDLAFDGCMMRFWFHNDNGADWRTSGNFNGYVDFTATTVEKPATYTVTFDENGGDTEADPQTMTVTSGSSVGTLPTAPTRKNYTFKGWNTKANGSGTAFTATTSVTSDITVYAQWERKNTPVDPKVAAYRVEHYQEQLDGSYTLSATEFPLYGEIGATVTAVPKTYEHYHVNHEKSNLTGIVKMPTAGEDGTPEILTLQVYYDLDTVTVSYDLNGGTGKDGISYAPETVKYGASVTIKDAPSKRGYTFEGWKLEDKTYEPGDSLAVTGDLLFVAQWHKKSSGGGSSSEDRYYILSYESNGGTEYKDERYKKNTVVELDKLPAREGYTFTGWYADEELTDRITSIKMTSDKTVYAGWESTGVPAWLNGDDHFSYAVGYSDGTVRPLNQISRAEVATIFFRLLNEDIREDNLTSVNTFADVNEGMWCNMAISTMAKLGVVKGRTPERFDPNAPITRAEFAAICARFDTSKRDGDSNFTDISGHWAEAEIERAASLSWIMGYTDGTFRPENYITRAEAMTMINRVLNRLPEDEDDLLDGMHVWPDNQPDAWYYLAVQEATNSHDFTRKGDVHEHWTKLTADPDWSRYQ